MKNAKNAHYWQVDNKIKNISQIKGALIVPSAKAWKEISWTKKYFKTRPQYGYFIWVKEKINSPLFTCISLANKNTSQKLQNLLIVEKNLVVKVFGSCNITDKKCSGSHKASGKIVLKPGAILKYEHNHLWGEKNTVKTNYEFDLSEKSELDYIYKNMSAPKELTMDTKVNVSKKAKANLRMSLNCLNSKVDLNDAIILKGQGSHGITRLRLVGRKNSRIKAQSQIVAQAAGQGHLDCQGLLVNDHSEIKLSPELIIKNKKALLTHEASIGKISEQELNYLRTRGFSEKQAINLIINGFLN
ncbi:MAG: hypothetical protein AVO34_01710 [Firmicutes bacterium ML8_F2]|jgi:uncharacterized protein|nr:MAG: hypothetical protein AVO34_01710 [Firmicutes bacterium ML8_F2]